MDVTFRRTGERRYSVTARPDRKLRRRGERLGRSERLAAEAQRAWVRGPRPLAPESLERVCTRLDELSARWSTLGIGGTLTVDWPESARTPHQAAPAPRRAARRPGGGRVHR